MEQIQTRLLKARIDLVQNRQKLLLTQIQILTLLGQFLTKNLNLHVVEYDPEAYDPWFAIDVAQKPQPIARLKRVE